MANDFWQNFTMLLS